MTMFTQQIILCKLKYILVLLLLYQQMKQTEIDEAQKHKKVKLKPLKQNKQNKFQFPRIQALTYQKTDTIKLILHEGKKVLVQTDFSFIKSVDGICSRQLDVIKDFIKAKDNILTQEESQQIHFKAKLHGQANIINRNSHKTKQVLESQSALNSLLCKCGCERFKGKKFPVCHDLQEINVLGSGIILFFLLMKYVTFAILSFVLVYSIYALFINFMGTYVEQVNNISSCTNSYCFFRDQASQYNRNTNQNYTKILSYIGLFAMVIWGLIIRISLEYGRFKNKAIDKNLTSASDYAIKINNLPYKHYNQQELLEYVQKIAKKAQQKRQQRDKNKEKDNFEYQQDEDETQSQVDSGPQANNFLNNFIGNLSKTEEDFLREIKSIQIIYNMEFSRKMILKIEELSAKIHKKLKKKQGKYFIQQKQKYQQIKHQLIQTYEVFADLRKKFLNDSNFRKKISTRTAIIEFKSKKAKNIILKQYSTNKITIFKAIKQRMKAFIFGQAGSEIIFKGQIPQLMRAPEPSDIIWQNCQKKESVIRMLLIYVITFIIILASFGLIVAVQYYSRQYLGLDNSQSSNKNSNAPESSLNTVLNIVTSIILQIINKILWFSMFYLLNLEYNHTNTSKIISQMSKTLFAMCINIIILPIIVNYGFGKSIYGAAGLSGIVFDYHISAVTINLILQLINPVFIILKFCIYIKCIRDKIIKLFYHKDKIQDDLTNQTYLKKIYELYQGMEFDIAQSYVFITSNIFHAVFYCELQPFILILLLIEAFFFFWISKIKVFKFCKIPLLLEILIFQVAAYQLMLVPIFYGTGGIFVSYVRNVLNPTHPFQYIAFVVSIVIGLLNFFNPQNIMQKPVHFLFKCFRCISPQSIIHLSRKTSNEKKQSEITLSKEKIVKQKRQQNYYKESNSITLLGFEKKLLGQINFNEIQQQLKTYCQSHLAQNKSNDIIVDKKRLRLDERSFEDEKPSIFDKSNQDFM